MPASAEIKLVSGEDLTPYRQASKAVHAVLQRYGPAERLGMDEVFVDASREVEARLRHWTSASVPQYRGHVHHCGTVALHAASRHRPQDLRAGAAPGAEEVC